ncbi:MULTISPECIES: hypothetical protein [unclassified Janthinobacterium]|uniref:hypothetical protein n=1 Tax=unclassified Janthinobacterium TaxID=2610881 RepID=UPI00161181AC|nr:MULTISPECIES: hypothetical protein [unclassified Janthinobacterium]MBB5367085.1 TolB-like protein [Janthinobacterium sp. K2C7]MBB5380437.1 TolB-like protein [Janthinobacterium sp. K2Li3]MBB5385467.1 TolB-like protein [Janthinobacterium sp. K2E3]
MIINTFSTLLTGTDQACFDAVTATVTAPQATIPRSEIMAALERLLGSAVFTRAHRMCRLLQFLVERRLACAAQNFKEYVIGVEVFNRNPALYDPADDPIVRVQVGRLRERLRLYYAGDGRHAGVIFSIPVGGYVPHIHRPDGCATLAGQSYMLALKSVRAIAADPASHWFSQGVSEELSDLLFRAFGSRIVPHTFSGAESADGTSRPPNNIRYWLEGSVRIEHARVRASFRLVDAWAACIAWSWQFDLQGPVTILLQEQLAADVCVQLQIYFSRASPPVCDTPSL